MKYKYFVSFEGKKEYSSTIGNITFDTNEKIKTGEQIAKLHKEISKNYNISNVCIINIVLLDEEY